MTIAKLRSTYRSAGRRQRDELWFMYIGMRDDFQAIEDAATNKCAECEHNPHTVYCSKYVAVGAAARG